MIFLRQRVHLLTGKGGVGRTTLAVALGLAAAQRGRRVLVAEVEDSDGSASALGLHFGRHRLHTTPVKVGADVHACRLSAHAGHELFAQSVIPVKALVKAALSSQALQGFMLATPAVHELGLFYHMLALADMRSAGGAVLYDFIVVDMPATGHALALSALPEIVLGLMPIGPIAQAMRRGQALFHEPECTASWVVTLPARLPVTEAFELLEGLRLAKVPVGGVVLNRFREDPFTAAQHAALRRMFAAQQVVGESTYRRMGLAQSSLDRLRANTDLPIITLPNITGIQNRANGQGGVQALVSSLLATGLREDDR